MEDSPAVRPVDNPDSAALTLLAARVAELEHQVAALNAAVRLATRLPIAAVAPPPPPPPPIHPDPPPFDEPEPARRHAFPSFNQSAPQKSLEDRLGSQLFNLIGIVALIVGSAWALKLAIEQGWIGVTARVIIGLAAGAGLILWSERFRRKGFAAFSYTLKAVGTGVLYLSLWAAFQLYHLLPAPIALALMILVTAWNAFMAFSQDAELLAAYALIGGLLTPVLLSTGGDHETFLFTYLAIIDLAIIVLQRSKPWSRLLPPAFLATVAYFIGYYARFFHTGVSYDALPHDWDTQSTETALFALIFFALFAVLSTKFWTRTDAPPDEKTEPTGILTPVLIPLANAAFLSLALYSVFQDSGLHTSLAWLMVALAALFLGLMRLQKTSLAAAMHLACAVIFLTIAIPLKASGHSLTTAWLVEGLVLYWASTRFETENKAPSRVLYLLSGAGYALGLGSVLFHWTWTWSDFTQPPFFSANLGSALVAVAVLAGAAWLSLPNPEASETSDNRPVLVAALACIVAVALLLTLREIASGFVDIATHPAFANTDFATALVALALLAATAWATWLIFQRDPAKTELLRLLAAVTLILFNLVAILTVEREIGALWTRAHEDLQRSLAISAFLMAYGGILLAIGFWRRNAFVRWQALLLILFTIAKVFLYDISGLSAGYRVASFLALGALLLTVSFAYQKDWLALKTPPPPEEDHA
jgi:uncharacterized membrane protein